MHSEIIMLTDVSGSMNKIDRATCEGFNSFIAEQQGGARHGQCDLHPLQHELDD